MNPKMLEKIRSLEPCFGTWLSLGSSVVAEMASQSGFDWLLIDLEHGCMAESAVLPMLQALDSGTAAAVVRVPSHDPSLIGRVLDWGADALMVPHVSTAEEARKLVQAMRYPPGGVRGYSRTVRAYGYGMHRPGDEIHPLLFVQIECREGVQNVDTIADVPGVDVLFVGPADLQLSLSLADGPDYEEALELVAAAAHGHGIGAGILIRNSNETAQRLQQGFTKLAIGSDMGMLREGLLRAAVKPDPNAPQS